MFRPSKKSPAPAPLYLTSDLPYCQACGRVVSSKAQDARAASGARKSDGAKYCSVQCRRKKPAAADRLIEQVFVAVLDGDEAGAAAAAGLESPDARDALRALIAAARGRKSKGDPRLLVSCGEIQAVFPFDSFDRKPSARKDAEESEAPDVTDQMVEGSAEDRNMQVILDIEAKQQEGMRRAEQKEMVKRAARRLVVFGHQMAQATDESAGEGPSRRQSSSTESPQHPTRFCEVVSGGGKVVEPSFAKGDWRIRWRDV